MLRKSLEGIRELDFQGLRDAGYRGAVFDKDNCLVSHLLLAPGALLKTLHSLDVSWQRFPCTSAQSMCTTQNSVWHLTIQRIR